MKFKTVIEKRPEIRRRKVKKSRLIMAVVIMVNVIFDTLLPFSLGVYFGLTKQMLYFFLFFILLFINIRLDYSGDIVKLTIIRGF